MKKGFMISCEDATEMVVRKSEEKLSGYDKFRLFFHLMMCKFCSLFEKQNKIIDEASSHLDEKVSKQFPVASKEKILQEILK